MKESQHEVDAYHKSDIWFYLRERGQERYKFLASLIPHDCKTILDAGCGESLIVPHLPPDKKYTGFDLSTYVIEKNKLTHKDTSGEFYVDDIFNAKQLRHFDCVLLLSVFAQLTIDEKLRLVRIYLEKCTPKIIIISSNITNIPPEHQARIQAEFNVTKNISKTFNLIDSNIQVGKPSEINARRILVIEPKPG